MQRDLVRFRAAGQLLGLLHRGVGRLGLLGVGRQVVVRTQRQGDAPLGHRAVRIDLRRHAKRANRLGVIECVHQPQTLVKVLLRHRIAGCDRVAMVAQVVDQFDERLVLALPRGCTARAGCALPRSNSTKHRARSDRAAFSRTM